MIMGWKMLCVVLFVVFYGLARATGPMSQADSSLTYLLRKIEDRLPLGADPAFNCAWREFALRYAQKIQPDITDNMSDQLVDALQLRTLCGFESLVSEGRNKNSENFSSASPQRRSHSARSRNNWPPESPRSIQENEAIVVYVAVNGNDSNNGTSASPKKTLQGALEAVRKARGLSEMDLLSDETKPKLSGRKAHDAFSNSSMPHASNQNTPLQPAVIFFREGVYYFEEAVLFTAIDSFISIMNEEAQSQVTFSGGRLLSGLQWKPTPSHPAIYQATVPSSVTFPGGIKALRVNGLRATLARYPNANAELDLFPKGYILQSEEWLPPMYHGHLCDPQMQCGVSVNVTIPVTDAWHGMYQNWTVGSGGACEIYDPPFSPWCSGDFYLQRQFPEMHTRHPSGLNTTSLPHAPYRGRGRGAVVHAWRPGHWYTWMFEVGDATFSNTSQGWTIQKNQNNIYGLLPTPRTSNDLVKYLGNFSKASDCFAACNTSKGCTTWTYHEPTFDDRDWAFGCYSRKDGMGSPVKQGNVTSGFYFAGVLSTLHFGAGGTQGGEGSDTAAEWFIGMFEVFM